MKKLRKDHLKKNVGKQNGSLKAGLVLTGIMALFIAVGFFYTPYDPDAMDAASKFAGISLSHPMGCDNFGRDIFSRILKGSGTTMVVAFGTVLIGAVCGTLVGAVTGYYGGWLDEVLMRINDAVASFPSILLALVFIGVLGPGKYNVIAALGIVFIPSYARIVRGEFLRVRNQDYILSAKLMGVGNLRIMFLHILPNAAGVLLSSLAIGFNNAVLAEAGMSFLGIGVQPPDASLGWMLSEAQSYLFTAPWFALFPGIVIILIVLGFGLISDGLQQ